MTIGKATLAPSENPTYKCLGDTQPLRVLGLASKSICHGHFMMEVLEKKLQKQKRGIVYHEFLHSSSVVTVFNPPVFAGQTRGT